MKGFKGYAPIVLFSVFLLAMALFLISPVNAPDTTEPSIKTTYLMADDTRLGAANGSGTNGTTRRVVFNLSVNDSGGDAKLSCFIYVNNITVNQSLNISNGNESDMWQGNNLSYVFPGDGSYDYYISCKDSNNNENVTTTRTITWDVTPPVIYMYYPTMGYNQSFNSSVNFTWKITDTNAINQNGTCHIYYYNMTGTRIAGNISSTHNTVMNYSASSTNLASAATQFRATGDYNWTIWCNDSFGNFANGTGTMNTPINFSIDAARPMIFLSSVESTNRSVGDNYLARINFTIVDGNTTLSSCGVTAFSSNREYNTTIAGVLNMTSKNVTCEVNVSASSLTFDGNVRFEPYAYDNAMPDHNYNITTNETNWTSIRLYTGWNLIATDKIMNFTDINAYSNSITQISWYNNSNYTQYFTTYVVGVGTNNATKVDDGDAVYVYVNSSITIQRWWNGSSTISYNKTMQKGWNQLTAFNATNMTLTQLCKENGTDIFFNLSVQAQTPGVNITYVSYPQPSNKLYYTFRCNFTNTYSAVTIPKGYGYWLYLDNNATRMLKKTP